MRGVQAGRPPIYVWEKEMEAIRIPTLILCGDEDEACVGQSLFMKRHIARSGLAFFPRSGHGINLEEPDLYNRFCLDCLDRSRTGQVGRPLTAPGGSRASCGSGDVSPSGLPARFIPIRPTSPPPSRDRPGRDVRPSTRFLAACAMALGLASWAP